MTADEGTHEEHGREARWQRRRRRDQHLRWRQRHAQSAQCVQALPHRPRTLRQPMATTSRSAAEQGTQC